MGKSFFIIPLLLTSFMTLTDSFCYSQELLFNIQFFDEEDGLSARSIYCVNQDDRGLIWVGTGNGLNRFDGNVFESMKGENNPLASGEIIGIKKRKDGRFWIQKRNATALRFDPRLEKGIPLPEHALRDYGELEILFPEGQSELVYFKNETGQIFYVNSQDSIVPYGSVRIPDHTVAKPTSWGTLLLFQNTSPHVRKEINESGLDLRYFPVEDKFYDFYDVKGDQIQGITDSIIKEPFLHEIFFYIEKEREITSVVLKKDGQPIQIKELNTVGQIYFRLSKDSKGNIWLIANERVLLFDKDGNLLKDLSEELGGFKKVRWISNQLFIDDHDRVWIATGLGLFLIQIKENQFQNYLHETGNESVRGICEIADDRVFIASYRGSKVVDKFSKKVLTTTSDFFVGVSKGRTDTIWCGRHGDEVGILEGESLNFKKRKLNISGSLALLVPFYDAYSGRVYLGTKKGLYYLDQYRKAQVYTKLNEFEDLQRRNLTFFYRNDEGLWIASDNGIYLLNDLKGIIGHYHFPNNNIKHICEDQAGIFWIATTGGGLIRWDRKSNNIKQFTTKDGLSHDIIYAVYEDNSGYLWMSSSNGLMRFEKSKGEVITFLPEDGIPHKEFNTFSHYQAKDGRLYFGGLNGVTAFYPEEVTTSENDAPFVITSFQQFDSKTGSLVNKTQNLFATQAITLDPDDKFFIVDFSLLDYSERDNIYAWRIIGLEEEWNYQKENSLRINVLHYGKYTLQIKAKGAGGQWAKALLSIPIDVRKPFYMEWYFIALAIIGIGLTIFAFAYLRFLRSQRIQLRLKKQVKERTIELSEKNNALETSNQIKDKLFAIIAHDLRGPVFSLQDVGRKLNYLIESQQVQRLKDYGETVDQSVSSLISLLNNLLNWANQNLKITSLNPKNLNVQKLASRSMEELKPMADKKNMDLNMDIPAALETYSDEQAVLTIIRNLLSNAIKFTPANGKIQMIGQQQKTTVLLSIKDNGLGIEADRMDHIFDLIKNKSTRGTNGESGTGLGLHVSKELAMLNGGDITVNSIPGKETVFTIMLPLAVKT